MLIRVKQIDNGELANFVQVAMSGASFSGNLNGYLNANGYLGRNVVYASGGPQIISGDKTFDISPTVPYSGTTGTVPSRKYVDDLVSSTSGALTTINVLRGNSNDTISGYKTFTGAVGVGNPVSTGDAVNLNTLLTASGVLGGWSSISGALDARLIATGGGLSSRIESSGSALDVRLVSTGGLLSAVKVTGSSVIPVANFTGISGTTVLYSGDQIFIFGGGGGAGSSNVKVTGSSAISSPNLTGLGLVTVTYDGTYVNISGAVGSSVSVTGSSPISSPNFTGVAGTNVTQSGNLVIISGGTYYNTNNTINITGTGNITNNFTSSGDMSNVFNNYNTFTGNLTNISFFFDPVPTGLNLVETFVSNNFTFSGARFACRQSGNAPINGGILSGKLYQVDQNNTEQTLYNFTFTTGLIYSGSPLFSTNVTGNNRVGLSITNLISGISQFTVGVFGY